MVSYSAHSGLVSKVNYSIRDVKYSEQNWVYSSTPCSDITLLGH
jgi:hypothetical protein